jgi:hypothetical protein
MARATNVANWLSRAAVEAPVLLSNPKVRANLLHRSHRRGERATLRFCHPAGSPSGTPKGTLENTQSRHAECDSKKAAPRSRTPAARATGSRSAE